MQIPQSMRRGLALWALAISIALSAPTARAVTLASPDQTNPAGATITGVTDLADGAATGMANPAGAVVTVANGPDFGADQANPGGAQAMVGLFAPIYETAKTAALVWLVYQ